MSLINYYQELLADSSVFTTGQSPIEQLFPFKVIDECTRMDCFPFSLVEPPRPTTVQYTHIIRLTNVKTGTNSHGVIV